MLDPDNIKPCRKCSYIPESVLTAPSPHGDHVYRVSCVCKESTCWEPSREKAIEMWNRKQETEEEIICPKCQSNNIDIDSETLGNYVSVSCRDCDYSVESYISREEALQAWRTGRTEKERKKVILSIGFKGATDPKQAHQLYCHSVEAEEAIKRHGSSDFLTFTSFYGSLASIDLTEVAWMSVQEEPKHA